ncbi:MAG TPA: DUF6624 domain-containing protein [Steroidobacteraceae bacterium]|nr:DUF6624 domain-containing protein [Steroidobacteraceae bacterium]
MKKWLMMVFCGAGVVIGAAIASEHPKVDAALAECDAHIAQMRAAFAAAPAAPGDDTWVKSKLQHMADVDQYVRKFSQEGYARGFSPDESAAFGSRISELMVAVDLANTTDLKQLLSKQEWFGISRFGEWADLNAWLLVQHADRDPAFQREILQRLEPLAARGETKPSHYALLYDRVALNYADPTKPKLQRYGTQGRCTGPGTWEPYPVEEPDKLDQRRRSVGLMPETDYQKLFKDLCHESTEETLRKQVEATKAGS